jgi:hypothetical protein
MRVFFLDLWMDLREKRLAPLAILLLGAIVAVPIVLANGKSEPPPPAPAPTATTASAAPVIESQTDEGPTESKLQTFSPRDPFEPTGSSGGGSSSGTSGTTSGTTTTPSTGTSTGTSSTPSSGGGGATTGTQPSTGTGTGTGTNGTGNTTGETKTTLFTYTVDARFGEGGDVKAYKDIKRLDLIPDSDNPKVVFLGVTTTGKTAVFLIDSNIGVDTAGKCRPSADECTFLYLRPDADHDEALLTDSDGTVYHLRLLAIHRVSVSSSNGSTDNSGNSGGSGGNSNSKRSPAFTGTAKRKSSSDQATVPGEDAPPGEPTKNSSFQQFFADGSADSVSK